MVGIFRTQKTTRTDFKMYKMIDKTTFCEVIELLRQQILFDRRIGETIQEAFGIPKKCSYKDNMAIQAIMKLLQIHFPKDEHGFCEIEHYCFLLEFGKIGDELQTSEEFYDFLMIKKRLCCGNWDEYGTCKCANNGQ